MSRTDSGAAALAGWSHRCRWSGGQLVKVNQLRLVKSEPLPEEKTR